MSSIVFVNRFYWPDIAATAQQLTDLSEDLAARGWEVTVICGTASYHDDGEDAGLAPDARNGVRIRRVRTSRFGRGHLLGRALDYLSFHLAAFWQLLTMPRPEIVVAMSDPPYIVAPVLLAGAVRGFKTVYYVQDLYPQVALALKVLHDGPFYRLMEGFSRYLHARCDGVIAISERMARLMVANGAAPERVATVEHWADTRLIRPLDPGENPFLEQHDLRNRFVVLYSGNAGRGHAIQPMIDAARRLRDNPEVVFLFIGGGCRFPELRRARNEGLLNIRLLDYVPREQLCYSLSSAGVSLVAKQGGAVGMLLPCKLYGILASGRPVLFMGSSDGDVAELIRKSDCGVVVPEGDGGALAAAIERLSRNRPEAERMGRNGRDLAVNRFDRSRMTAVWTESMLRVLGAPAGAAERERHARLPVPDRPTDRWRAPLRH